MSTSEVFQQFHVEMITTLPMNDAMFLAQLFAEGLLPGDLKHHIDAQMTSAQKSLIFLKQKIKSDISVGNSTRFNKLLDDSEYISVKALAEKIKTALKEGPVNTDNAAVKSKKPKKEELSDPIEHHHIVKMAHMKVYEDYEAKLVRVLPMNDVTFITQLSHNKILPDNVEAHIKSLPTQSDKADYYLTKNIESSLDIGETEEFNNLITVMEKCGYPHVERLAKAMKSDLDKELKGVLSPKIGDKRQQSTSKSDAISPTEIKVFLVPVGDLAEIECNGKCGGSFLWEGHDFAIILPPDCADGTVTVTLKAYLPSSTQKHGFVSAVFGITTNIKKFKKPITIRFPHCVNIESKRDKENLQFVILHNDSCEFRNGYFEIGEKYGSIVVTNFCKLGIIDTIYNYTISSLSSFTSRLFTSGSSPSHNATIILLNMEDGHSNVMSDEAESNNRKYLELLILPEFHNKASNWNGSYCIVQDIHTFVQTIIEYFKKKSWINSSTKVLTRRVTFSDTTNDAIAKVCLVDKPTSDKVIHLMDDEIPKKQINILSLENDKFPRCLLVINGKLSSSSSTLKVNGLIVEGNSPSQFNLSSPTGCGYELIKGYDHSCIVKKAVDDSNHHMVSQ